MAYTPFLRPTKMFHLDGKYRYQGTGETVSFRRMTLMGFIDCDTEQPYDGYRCIYTDQEGIEHRKAHIAVEEFEKYVRAD